MRWWLPCILMLYASRAHALRQCLPGSYANTPSSCAWCPARQWKNGTDARTACEACPLGSGQNLSAGARLSACRCDPGFEGADGGPCVPCGPGTYKASEGPAQCAPAAAALCPPGQHRQSTSNQCAPCPASTWKRGTNNATACSHAVHAQMTQQQALAAQGILRAEPCTDCRLGSYSASVAATTSAACTECSSGTYSTASGATTNATCANCQPGTYAPRVRANAACAQCAADTFSDATRASGNASCIACNSSAVSAAGATQCVTCPDGQYKAAGSLVCVACPAGQYRPAGSDVCVTCPDGEYRAAGSVVCAPCKVSHFCTGGAATPCDANSKTRPHNRTDARAASDCLCDPGYSHRPPQHYFSSHVISDNECYPCAPGYYNAATGRIQCSRCGPGLFSRVNASRTIDDCAACEDGSFSAPGEQECTACPANSHAPALSGQVTDCECDAGYTAANGGGCTACPANSHAPALSGQVTDCECDAGYTAANGGGCTVCDAGYTRANGGGCTVCDAGTFKAETGAASCMQCLPGQYAPPGAVRCSNCPLNASSVQAGGAKEDCTCEPGFTGADGQGCVPCPAGAYKAGAGNASCASCPPDTYGNAPASISCAPCPRGSNSSAGSIAETNCVVPQRANPAPVSSKTQLPRAAVQAPPPSPVQAPPSLPATPPETDEAPASPPPGGTAVSPVVIGIVVVGVIVVGGVAVSVGGAGVSLPNSVQGIATTQAGAQIRTDPMHSRDVQYGGACYVDISYPPLVYPGPLGGGVPPEGHYEYSDAYDYHTHAPHQILPGWWRYDGYHEAPHGW